MVEDGTAVVWAGGDLAPLGPVRSAVKPASNNSLTQGMAIWKPTKITKRRSEDIVTLTLRPSERGSFRFVRCRSRSRPGSIDGKQPLGPCMNRWIAMSDVRYKPPLVPTHLFFGWSLGCIGYFGLCWCRDQDSQSFSCRLKCHSISIDP